MKKRLLSILLTACMAFSSSPLLLYAASEQDITDEDTNVAESGEKPVGVGEIREERVNDRDEMLQKYRNLLAERVGEFRITMPIEAKYRNLEELKPTSIVFDDRFNEDDSYYNNWEGSPCFTSAYADWSLVYGSDYSMSGRVIMYLNNVILWHTGPKHCDEQVVTMTFPEAIPEGIDIEVEGIPAEFNDDRTKVRVKGDFEAKDDEDVNRSLRIDFINLLPSDIMEWYADEIRQWLVMSDDVFNHTGVPCEGDYLYHHIDGSPRISALDPVEIWFDESMHTYYYDLSYDFKADYYSTGDMEEQVAEEVDRVLEELELDGKSDYEKLKAIHDYICANTAYEYPEDGDEPPMLKHSAYSALIEKKAVCDGYANLFYRMCLKAGIDARIIYGKGRNESHAWNIVKLGDLYYDVDVTWDSSSLNKEEYFLKGHEDFLNDHTPKDQFTGPDFTGSYPISEYYYRQPEFKTASLNLGGNIGVNLMMELTPNPSFNDFEGSYMEFTVNGGEPVRQDYDPERRNQDGTLAKFTCYVSSVQMADTITAVFHYFENGEERQVSLDYTIENYIQELERPWNPDKDRKLARAIADYGYYAQKFLSQANGWSLDGENPDHQPMTLYYTKNGYSDNDIAGILDQLSEYGPVVQKSGDISKISFSLALNSDTRMNVFFNTQAGYSGAMDASVSGEPAKAGKVSKDKYKVVIPDIGASMLGNRYDIVVSTDAGDTTLRLSALDYAKIILSNQAASQAEKNAMAAVYRYYEAFRDYRTS